MDLHIVPRFDYHPSCYGVANDLSTNKTICRYACANVIIVAQLPTNLVPSDTFLSGLELSTKMLLSCVVDIQTLIRLASMVFLLVAPLCLHEHKHVLGFWLLGTIMFVFVFRFPL